MAKPAQLHPPKSRANMLLTVCVLLAYCPVKEVTAAGASAGSDLVRGDEQFFSPGPGSRWSPEMTSPCRPIPGQFHHSSFVARRSLRQTGAWQYVWMASLRTESDEHVCGGTLIAPQIVLTAGHCFDEKVNPNIPVSVDLGRKMRFGDDCSGFEKLEIMNTIVHKGYSPQNSYDHDIALLVLDSPTTRQPVKLATSSECFESDEGCNLCALGWGITDYKEGLAEQLRVVNPPTLDRETCEEHRIGQVITDNMLCAGNITKGGTGNCKGDSGGPAFIRTFGEPKQVGIVSWSNGCGYSYTPEIMASVPAQISWIYEQLCSIEESLNRSVPSASEHTIVYK